MAKTRSLILEYIERNPGADSAEIARALSLSPADIRHHLRALNAEGLLQRSRPAAAHPGRTAYCYRRSGLPELSASRRLAAALLTAVLELGSGSKQVLDQAARQMAGETTQGPLRQRLDAAVHRLNQEGYAARWEAAKNGPRLLLRRCPYAGLAAEQPALCLLDETYLTLLTGQSGRLTPARPEPGPTPCVFQLNQKSGG